MWSKEKRNQEMELASSTSVFAAGLSLAGDIESTSDIRIEGEVKGNVSTKRKLVVGSSGIVRGDVSAAEICVMGEVYGDIFVLGLAKFTSSAKIKGKIVFDLIEIEAGALVEGTLMRIETEQKGELAITGMDTKTIKFDKEPQGKGFVLDSVKMI